MSLPEPPNEPAAAASPPEGATAVGPEDPLYALMVARIAEFVAARKCVLFLGSAAHAHSPNHGRPPKPSPFDYPPAKCPPIGKGLAKILAEVSHYPDQDRDNLPRVSQHIESSPAFGRHALVEAIKKAVHEGKEPSPALRMLAELEFPLVVTTNYDQLYERALDLKAAEEREAAAALADEGERQRALARVTAYDVSIYRPVVYDKKRDEKIETLDCPKELNPRRPFILKIHGDVSRPESLVVTDEDYIQFVLRMSDQPPYHPFGKNVLRHLIEWPTLFIGYSLLDYNLRLLLKTLRWRLDNADFPVSYSVDREPDRLIRYVWESRLAYVSFVVKDLWDFIPRLYGAVRGEPPTKFYAPQE